MPVCAKAHIKHLQSPFFPSCASVAVWGKWGPSCLEGCLWPPSLEVQGLTAGLLACNSGARSGKKGEEDPLSNSEKAKAPAPGLSLNFMWQLPRDTIEMLCCAPQHSRFQRFRPKGCHADVSLKWWSDQRSEMGKKGWSMSMLLCFPFLS